MGWSDIPLQCGALRSPALRAGSRKGPAPGRLGASLRGSDDAGPVTCSDESTDLGTVLRGHGRGFDDHDGLFGSQRVHGFL